MKSIRRGSAVGAVLLLLAGLPAYPETALGADARRSPAPSSASNPLIEEMLTLDNMFRDIISAVALGDAGKVRTAVASMHGTEEKTREGIHAGAVVLPRNSARISEFVERDRKFHEMLEALERAAGRNHQQEMLRISKLLLDGCVQCHRVFRK